MEFIETLSLTVVIILGVSFLLFIYKFLPNIKQNKAKNTAEKTIGQENLKQTIRDMQENFGIQVTQLKKDRNRLQGIINRNQMNVNENEEEEQTINMEDYVFDKEMVRPMLENWGMKVEALDNPLLQNIIYEKVKGNEEILITLGILKPKNANSSESSSSQTKLPTETISNWA